jgi:hypothetical protein
MDLYEAFEAVVCDEEDFRAELVRYAAINDSTGHPQVRPEDVPPMVFQQVPWLKPTATSKMYNAELTQQGIGGKLQDFPQQAERGNGTGNAEHFSLIRPLLAALSAEGEFHHVDDVDPTTSRVGVYRARYGIIDARLVREAVARFTWTPNWSFVPHLRFLDQTLAEGTLTEFVILVPELGGSVRRPIGDYGGKLPVLTRNRRSDRSGFSGSSKRQRDAIETIAGKRVVTANGGHLDGSGGPLAVSLHTATRGAMLLTFALDNGNPDARVRDLPDRPVAARDVATLFSYALPYAAAPIGRIGFKTRKSGGGAIIDRPKDTA